MARTFTEGSKAVAEVVRVCRPNVISAYPITPQTHIVEELSAMVANGRLKAESVNVESEFSAASVVLGASATGARTYTATTSQGMLLMTEVLFNISGMRLPVVLTCANRAVSSPINIWNDQQDSISVRDAGWIQLYAEDIQEAADLHLQAFRIAERPDVLLPVMVCMDGFVLTHSYEPVDLLSQEEADEFLPPYKPEYYLTPKNPLTYGAMLGPEAYMESRYQLDKALMDSAGAIVEVADEFKKNIGRYQGALIDTYMTDDAEIILVAMGSIISTIKEAVDKLRGEGQKVGVLKVRAFRPFPKEEVCKALEGAKDVLVMDRAFSPGYGGVLTMEIKAAFCGRKAVPQIKGHIAGLGGRDINVETILNVISNRATCSSEDTFVDLKEALIGG
ncbi:MAG: pyruvate ferredoxin oxidoreductase [Candidatus Brocadiales bacterium]|nr:pyruvate ferredoxin oxidoreductase [Candidatus Bathyanammoxibius sp.]MCQ4575046.1 pyruvate ferredoxin oxidoreductase [Candidatus Bathyanammoxibius amoris]